MRDVDIGIAADAVTRSEPESQVTACRMTHRRDAREVEWIIPRQPPDEIGGGSDIEKRSRPTATRVSDASVLDVPDGESGRAEREGLCARVREVVLGEPDAAVNIDDDRMRPVARRQTQLAELQRIRTIRDAQAGRRFTERREIRAVINGMPSPVPGTDQRGPPPSAKLSSILSPSGSCTTICTKPNSGKSRRVWLTSSRSSRSSKSSSRSQLKAT